MPSARDVVLAAELLGDVSDRVDHGSSGSVVGVSRREARQDAAILVDDARGDLGPADVDADRELVGHQTGSVRARSAAPMMPAALPSAASRTSACGSMRAGGQVGLERLDDRFEQQVPSSRHTSADRDHARVEDRSEDRKTFADPATDLGQQLDRQLVAALRQVGEPGPVILVGSPSASAASASVPGSPLATRSRASRTSALPLAYCSKQPCWPQPHSMPLGTMRM